MNRRLQGPAAGTETKLSAGARIALFKGMVEIGPGRPLKV